MWNTRRTWIWLAPSPPAIHAVGLLAGLLAIAGLSLAGAGGPEFIAGPQGHPTIVPLDAWAAPDSAAKIPNPVPADPESIAAGKTQYERNCLTCHGAAGKGDGPAAAGLETSPGDLSAPALWKQTDGAVFWKVTTGRGAMRPFRTKLTEKQRWDVVNYVRTLAPKPASAPAASAAP